MDIVIRHAAFAGALLALSFALANACESVGGNEADGDRLVTKTFVRDMSLILADTAVGFASGLIAYAGLDCLPDLNRFALGLSLGALVLLFSIRYRPLAAYAWEAFTEAAGW